MMVYSLCQRISTGKMLKTEVTLKYQMHSFSNISYLYSCIDGPWALLCLLGAVIGVIDNPTWDISNVHTCTTHCRQWQIFKLETRSSSSRKKLLIIIIICFSTSVSLNVCAADQQWSLFVRLLCLLMRFLSFELCHGLTAQHFQLLSAGLSWLSVDVFQIQISGGPCAHMIWAGFSRRTGSFCPNQSQL